MDILKQLQPFLKGIDPEISHFWDNFGNEIDRITYIENPRDLMSVVCVYLNKIGSLYINNEINEAIYFCEKVLVLLENNSKILDDSEYKKWHEYILAETVCVQLEANKPSSAFKTASKLKKSYPKGRYSSLYYRTLFSLPSSQASLSFLLILFFTCAFLQNSIAVSLVLCLIFFGYLFYITHKILYLIYLLIILLLLVIVFLPII